MELKIFQVDAFTDQLFKGNPAAVVLLNSWIEEEHMQSIAFENNLSETAFIVRKESAFYEIRWFTPLTEVDLCGHATLAAARVIFEHFDTNSKTLEFYSSRSGALKVSRDEELITLDFPADLPERFSPPDGLYEAIGHAPEECLKGKTDYLLVYPNQEAIEKLKPNFYLLKSVKARGIICTSPGQKNDFVSRFFAPAVGINEDPVTGSAHTTLTPYWSSKLEKVKLFAMQISLRGGELVCELRGDRVFISGRAVIYMDGTVTI